MLCHHPYLWQSCKSLQTGLKPEFLWVRVELRQWWAQKEGETASDKCPCEHLSLPGQKKYTSGVAPTLLGYMSL